jgi:hypothetical protein
MNADCAGTLITLEGLLARISQGRSASHTTAKAGAGLRRRLDAICRLLQDFDFALDPIAQLILGDF